MANWFRLGEWLPIAMLAPDFSGPVVYADETQTVQWLDETGQARGKVKHKEHARDDQGALLYDGEKPDGSQKPKIVSRDVLPAFFAPVRMVS